MRHERVAELCTGRLDAVGRQALAQDLGQDAMALTAVVDQLAMAGMLRAGLGERDEAATAARVVRLIQLRRGSQQRRVARAVGRRLRRRRATARPSSITWWGIAAVAATLLLALWWRPWSQPGTAIEPPATVLSGSLQTDVAVFRAGDPLPWGVLLNTEEAVIRLPDGGSLRCHGGVVMAEAVDRWRLRRGRCTVQVPSRTAGPFVLEAPHASVTVLGTQFTVAVDMATTVTVMEGRVRVLPEDGAPLELAAGSSWSSDDRLQADFDDGVDPGWTLSGPLPRLADGRLVLQRRPGLTTGGDSWFGHSGVRSLAPLRLPVRVRFTATVLEPHPDAILAVALHRGPDDDDGFGWVGVRDNQLIVGQGSDATEVAMVDLDQQQHWDIELGPDDLRIVIDGEQQWHGRHGWPVRGACLVSIGGNAKTTTPWVPLLAIDDCVLIPLE